MTACQCMGPCSGCGVCKCRCRCPFAAVGVRGYGLADGLADAKAIVSTWPEYKQRAAGEDPVLGLHPVDADDDNPCIVRGDD